MKGSARLIIILLTIVYAESVTGQQVPFNPISYRIFSPLVYNPAIAGSKDFFSTDFVAGFQGKVKSQLLSANTRFSRKVPGYLMSSKSTEFIPLGAGLALYNDMNEVAQTAGASGIVAWHLPLDKRSLSFLSLGVAGKGIFHHYNGNEDLSIPQKEFIFPNIDAGIYFYSPSVYTGLSATNILSPPEDKDSLFTYRIPVNRQYNFLAGYKFVIIRSLNLVIEPSVIIVGTDSLTFSFQENIQPMLKIYAGNFCAGSYFNDYNKISFFFQYRYPRFYVATFFALPKETAYFKQPLTIDVAFGINFSKNGSGYTSAGHW